MTDTVYRDAANAGPVPTPGGPLSYIHWGPGILGAIVKDPVSDQVVWQEYLETVIRERDGWRDFYRAARHAG